ncbi:MAG TPA: penicillin-binding protein 1A [Gammaproteobacteria bacterium]|nr:penicillin-binding protein 1A [Gammaproteobacteria bacterium]
MKFLRKALRAGLLMTAAGTVLGLLLLTASYIYIAPNLPSIETLRDIRLQVPLRIYTRDMKLIAEFGEKKRTPIRFYETPDLMIQAILAAEDDRFFQHPGVDYHGILRAALNLIRTGEKTQGGSTITMQVARNFFLSREKTYLRKLSEIFLALKIERELSKEEILELYLNKIYLGNRAYGIGAAAQTYYGVPPQRLTLAQMAMIAGLPKAPSRYNPLANRERAVQRRNYVLRRMLKLGYIDAEQYRQAIHEEDNARLHGLDIEVETAYVAEMVRNRMLRQYGELAYTAGFRVITTIESRLQLAANAALRKALLDYDRRHGYRGPEAHVDLAALQDSKALQQVFKGRPPLGGLLPALVVSVGERDATVLLADGRVIQIPWQGLAWARPYVDDNHLGPPPARADEILSEGDLVRVHEDAKTGWQLSQLPEVEGALVALRPRDGAIAALAGGFDFDRSKFNRVTQASRQPGSSFKPFIYSAALEKGFTAASIINDAPVVFDDPGLEDAWRPENYSGKFFGPTRLREALIKSRNLVSIRLLRSIGIDYTLDYIARFGFPVAKLPRNLSLALGSGAVTPLQLARGYTVFANGGYRVLPYYIERILGPDDQVVMEADPVTACPECESLPDEAGEGKTMAAGETEAETAEEAPRTPRLAERVITAENAYLMTSMMRDVIRRGTGRRARSLGRHDIAGKTGTTNDQRDAWFAGFNPDLVAISWVGFDKTRSLGNRETGGRAALPMWIAFMGKALHGVPERPLLRPPGLVTVRIDPATGLRAAAHQKHTIFETFRIQNVPRRYAKAPAPKPAGARPATGAGDEVPEQLF